MSSAFARGAFVTATLRTPLMLTHVRRSVSPGSRVSCDAARRRNSASFSSHVSFRASRDNSGHSAAKMSSFVRPAMCARKKASSMGTPPFLLSLRSMSEKTAWWIGSVSVSVPSMSKRKPYGSAGSGFAAVAGAAVGDDAIVDRSDASVRHPRRRRRARRRRRPLRDRSSHLFLPHRHERLHESHGVVRGVQRASDDVFDV
mmetsp:Transcript_2902/g.9486  ORF Transcript_2902/g.9486 Transcript_2902/m.9486 type:complete len:201 (-) Transcript_2902:25-627(-)